MRVTCDTCGSQISGKDARIVSMSEELRRSR